MNCFIRHLKENNLIQKDFEEFPSRNDFNLTDCENFVTVVENFYYERIRNGSTFDVEIPDVQELIIDQGKCIEKQLRNDSYGDLILKSLIYDALKPLNDELTMQRNQTVKKLQEVLQSSISACTFTALYETYISIRRNNYCARKYVVDNDVLGLRNFNLTLNPFHIDISGVNCTELIQKMIEDVSSDESTPTDNFNAIQLLSHEWGVIFLTEITVSLDQREIEKKKYQEDLKEITVPKSVPQK